MVDNESVFPHEILFEIAKCNWRVYSAMLVCNRKLHKDLMKLDPGKMFLRRIYTGTFQSVKDGVWKEQHYGVKFIDPETGSNVLEIFGFDRKQLTFYKYNKLSKTITYDMFGVPKNNCEIITHRRGSRRFELITHVISWKSIKQKYLND